jgi:hypothetical protein
LTFPDNLLLDEKCPRSDHLENVGFTLMFVGGVGSHTIIPMPIISSTGALFVLGSVIVEVSYRSTNQRAAEGA